MLDGVRALTSLVKDSEMVSRFAADRVLSLGANVARDVKPCGEGEQTSSWPSCVARAVNRGKFFIVDTCLDGAQDAHTVGSGGLRLRQAFSRCKDAD